MLFSDTSPSGQGSKEIGVIPVTISKNCVASRTIMLLYFINYLSVKSKDFNKIAFALGT